MALILVLGAGIAALWSTPWASLAASAIAVLAFISGAYSMTKQAIQLGFPPRMTIRYTSVREMGQIYMPAVNWALLLQAIRRDGLDPRSLNRAERTAVYAVADPTTVPQALLHNLKHNQVLHARNVILTVVFQEVPWVSMDRRVQVVPLGHGFWRVTLNFGFMNTPDVPRALELTQSHGLHIPVFETSYFLSREAVVPTPGGGMANWRERLFAAMSRNAGGVAEFFRLPSNAVLEVGTRVEI